MASPADIAHTLPSSQPEPEPRVVRLEFRGSGGEYFRIWIVNIALSILTLGIFSAWAKVRNKRYFYGNTVLDGSAFDYTANPVNILIGRLIMVAYVVVYTVVGSIFPWAETVIIVVTVPLVPWVINRALSFNHRYCAHRSLRFGFEGSYWRAFVAFIALPFLALLTFGLVWPLAAHRRKQYLVENSRYGRNFFAFNAKLGTFFATYVIAAALVFVLFFTLGLFLAGAVGLGTLMGGEQSTGTVGDVSIMTELFKTAAVVVALVGYLTIFIVPTTYVQTAITNHLWQTNQLQSDSFDMRMQFLRVLWIQISNLVLIIITLGLFVPFAKVRMVRYRLECLSMCLREGASVYRAGDRDQISATGEELGNAFDLDLGL